MSESRDIWEKFLEERAKGYGEFSKLRAQGREAEAKALDEQWQKRERQAQDESNKVSERQAAKERADWERYYNGGPLPNHL